MTAYRCTLCNRPLRVAAVTMASKRGPLHVGPTCARRAGLNILALRKARRAAARVQRQAAHFDSRQMALELEGVAA